MKKTELMRKTVTEILCGLDKKIFAKFNCNPEEFVMKAAKIIIAEKNNMTLEHLSYSPTGENYDDNIFDGANLNGTSDNTIFTPNKNLFSGVIFDSEVEKNFAEALDKAEYVEIAAQFFHYDTIWQL